METVDHMSEGMSEEGVADRLEQHGEAFAGFIGDVQANVLDSISAQSVGPEGFVENFQGTSMKSPLASPGPLASPWDAFSLCEVCLVMTCGSASPRHTPQSPSSFEVMSSKWLCVRNDCLVSAKPELDYVLPVDH